MDQAFGHQNGTMSPPTSTGPVDSTKEIVDDKSKSTRRKLNKPLIEKRRRARINGCLSQLKTIVLGAKESKTVRSSKLEKADILEMTVEFVKNRLPDSNNDTNDASKDVSGSDTGNGSDTDYLAGYSKCLAEISTFIEQTRTNETSLKRDIVEHVTSKVKGQLTSLQDQNEDSSYSTNITNQNMPVTPLPKLPSPNKSNPIPILPLVKTAHVENHVTAKDDVPMDLRTNISSSSETETSEKTSECSPSECVTSNGPAIIQQQAPLGVLYGGQVMLLVQLPQTVTSTMTSSVVANQQFVPSVQVGQLANQLTEPSANAQTTTSLTTSNQNILQVDPSLFSQPSYTHNAIFPGQFTNGNSASVGNLQLVNFLLPVHSGANVTGPVGSHWRPW